MARLVHTPPEVVKLMEYDFKADPRKELKKVEDGLRKIEEQYDTLHFPVADGAAIYAVYSYKPLQIFHVPFLDAWHADPALIRGLTAKDVKERCLKQKNLKRMFSR